MFLGSQAYNMLPMCTRLVVIENFVNNSPYLWITWESQKQHEACIAIKRKNHKKKTPRRSGVIKIGG